MFTIVKRLTDEKKSAILFINQWKSFDGGDREYIILENDFKSAFYKQINCQIEL